jgi:hypothetical protein
MPKKELPQPPQNWRRDAEQAIKFFDPPIQSVASRILSRRETEMALVYMMDAAEERWKPGDFYHALRICSHCANPRRPPFASRNRAREISSAIRRVLDSEEIAFFLKETHEGRIARRQLEKAGKFSEESSKSRKAAPFRYEHYECFFQLHKMFQAIYGRPVMKAIGSWMKAAFPRSVRRIRSKSGPEERPVGRSPAKRRK